MVEWKDVACLRAAAGRGALQGKHVLMSGVRGSVAGAVRGRYGLEVAEVVGLKGIVVAGAERSPRLDHLRNATRVRYREPL